MTLLPGWCATPPLTRRLRAVQGPGTQQARRAAHLWAVRGGLLGKSGPFLVGWGWPLTAGLLFQGEALLQKLQQLLDRNVSLAVATSTPTLVQNSTDLQVLVARGRFLPSWAWGQARAVGPPGRGRPGAQRRKRLQVGFPGGWFQGAGRVISQGAEHRVVSGPC